MISKPLVFRHTGDLTIPRLRQALAPRDMRGRLDEPEIILRSSDTRWPWFALLAYLRAPTYPQVITGAVSLRVRIKPRKRWIVSRRRYLNMKKKTTRYYTGVSLEPEVSSYLDDLAGRMGMSRSWVLNTIVYEYAKFIEQKNLRPLASREAVIRL